MQVHGCMYTALNKRVSSAVISNSYRLLNMKTLKDRVVYAMNKAGVNQSDLARRVGITRGAVSHWVNGETEKLEGENLTTAARALGVDAHWLATGKGSPDSGAANTAPGPDVRGKVPLLSTVQAGDYAGVLDGLRPSDAEMIDTTAHEAKAAASKIVANSSCIYTHCVYNSVHG